MSDSPRVAVYLDFDNVVISRYDNLFGSGAWRKDHARTHVPGGVDNPVGDRLGHAQIDIGAIIDYATSFGTVAFTRAYADWSVPANASYRQQLIDRAVDLVQLFTTSGMKNGADIRLSVDAVDDLFQHADLTHVVIAAGDSDYIALAQRCKRLGRYVVGIGVSGSTSAALVAACDEFIDYADLPSVTPPDLRIPDPSPDRAPDAAPDAGPDAGATKAARKTTTKAPTKKTDGARNQKDATALLIRAVRVGLEKSDDEWLYGSGVKSQMQRMNSSFKEKALGYSSFRAFVESRDDVVDTRLDPNGQLQLRLRSQDA